MKRVLVTGAAGFVGQRIVRQLRNVGYTVVALDVRPVPTHLLQDGIPAMLCNVESVPESKLRDVDAVVHTAAYIPKNHEDFTEAQMCLRENAGATLALLQRCTEAGVKHVIYLSTAAVYVGLDPQVPVRENDPVYPTEYGALYAATKLLGELYCQHYARRYGLCCVCLRLGSVYGPGMRPESVVAKFMQQAAMGGELLVKDEGQSAFDFVYVSDVASAVEKALGLSEPDIINIGSGSSTSVYELADLVCQIYRDRRPRIIIEPKSGNAPVRFPALDVSRAMTKLGFRPTNLREGLLRYRQELEEH